MVDLLCQFYYVVKMLIFRSTQLEMLKLIFKLFGFSFDVDNNVRLKVFQLRSSVYEMLKIDIIGE